jgi:hypothetical protein
MKTLFNLTKKANRSARVTLPKEPLYLIEAECYQVEFTSKNGVEFDKVCVKGTDAITGLGVAGIELHGKEWQGAKNVVLSTYTKSSYDEKGRVKGTYTHSNGRINVTESQFKELVADAIEQMENSDNDDLI